MSSAEGASAPLYVVTSSIWDHEQMAESLQQPEVYHDLDTANESAKLMMNRYSEKLKLPKGTKNWNSHHHSGSDGSYFGVLAGGSNGHIGARVKVFKTAASGDAVTGASSNEVAMKAEGEEEMVKDEEDSDTKIEAEDAEETTKIEGEEEAAQVQDDEEVAKAEEDDEQEEEKKPVRRAKMKKTAVIPATHRKKIPEGLPDCLKDLKLLFTGTFETMDRKTSIATAIKYGGQVVSKLEDTNYIVLGTRAGPKKLQEINEKELDTISEEEFFQILEKGVPKEKRDRMAAQQAADDKEEPKEESEEEKPVMKRKGAAASASNRKRTKK
ncbi:RFC1-like protein [Apiospora marii]|uniref:RFC1-like protein n=1 Tax=Apiospora marii TaxID=335849 RepID=A0ABR1RV43_9PEZI